MKSNGCFRPDVIFMNLINFLCVLFSFHPEGILASEGEQDVAVKDIVPCKIFYCLTPERVLSPFYYYLSSNCRGAKSLLYTMFIG